jgi:hypothetical protein
MARPKNPEATVVLEVGFTPKAIKYLDVLKEMDGFGTSRAEIIRAFVWKELNRLIEVERLQQIE